MNIIFMRHGEATNKVHILKQARQKFLMMLTFIIFFEYMRKLNRIKNE